MTLESNNSAAPPLSATQWVLIGGGLIALQATILFARADLQLRLHKALARRGAELGKLAALHRLVHVLPYHPRLPVLRGNLAAAAAAALAGAPDRCDGGRRRLGAGGEFQLDHRAIPHGYDVAGLFRRQHRQFGFRYAVDGGRLPAGAKAPGGADDSTRAGVRDFG